MLFIMKKRPVYLLIFFILLLPSLSAKAQSDFHQHFINRTLRLDYTQSGNANTSVYNFEQLKQEPQWAGSVTQLIDPLNYGQYRVMVYDSASQQLVYSRGYSSLFREWQDTPEAGRLNRSFYETVLMPFPKKTIRVVLEKRLKNQSFKKGFELYVNPKNYFINKEKPRNFSVEKLQHFGNPHKKVDVVILPEGYTKKEMDKFRKDCKRFVQFFNQTPPFSKRKKDFNFWLVMAPSEETGTDSPGENIWKKTLLNTSFYTFDSKRYLTSQDVKAIRNLAACAPYDQIYILVNTDRYGGGGIYNYYNLCTSDHPLSLKVFTHEFGHAFGSLADEYAYGHSDPARLYDLSKEPYEPNITTLIDFNSKWADLVKKNTPVPTPDSQEYRNKVGAFEGAGYVSKKVYRPVWDCKMRSNDTNSFCPVCTRSLNRMIDLYTK